MSCRIVTQCKNEFLCLNTAVIHKKSNNPAFSDMQFNQPKKDHGALEALPAFHHSSFAIENCLKIQSNLDKCKNVAFS